MNRNSIINKFEAIGARIRIRGEAETPLTLKDPVKAAGEFKIDVAGDRQGQYFDIRADGALEMNVLDLRPRDRSLLLMVKVYQPGDRSLEASKLKLLCGFDEQEWFAAQAPTHASRDVESAKQALKPDLVVWSEKQSNVKNKQRHRRKNKGFIRQGEWFFLPRADLNPDKIRIRRKEPIFLAGERAGSKPHVADEAFRRGGEQVYYHRRYARSGLLELEKAKLFEQNQKAANASGWQVMVRNPELFVRGGVRHPDHKTVILRDWHRVVVNREVRSEAVVFLD